LSATATFVLPLLEHARAVEPEVWAVRLSEARPPDGAWPVVPIGDGASGWRRWMERVAARGSGFELREERRFASHLRRSLPPDLVHAHFGPQGYAAAEPCRRAGIPLVTTFYGYDLGIARETAWARRYAALWRKGAAFLVEGPFMAGHLARLGAPAERIHVQPLPVAVERVPFRPRARRPGEPVQLLQVARFVEKKGIDLSVRALARVPGTVLTVVGDGPLRGALAELVRQEGVEARVRFLGPRTRAEVAALLASADLLVQPSRTASDGDTEGGAPYILLEAQAAGLCVVASRHADIPNTVAAEAWFGFGEDDLAGAVSALEDAIRAAPEWPVRGRAARAFIEQRHAAGPLVARLEAAYRSLCDGVEDARAGGSARLPA
jgi:colanic acid/amylovoran biosynthesis glycosyltransferase